MRSSLRAALTGTALMGAAHKSRVNTIDREVTE